MDDGWEIEFVTAENVENKVIGVFSSYHSLSGQENQVGKKSDFACVKWRAIILCCSLLDKPVCTDTIT